MDSSERIRHIAHLNIRDFNASLEELRHPEFRKGPLVLAETRERAVIQGINAIARMEGLREGMPVSQAQRLCRRVRTIPLDLGFYREQHERLVQHFSHISPLVEGPFPGRYFVDLTGTRRLWGPPPHVACRMERQLMMEVGLNARVGLAPNKLVSQVASSCVHPGDLSCIFPGWETAFLAPLPVTSLPGVGSKTAQHLGDLNIGRIGQLASLPAGALASVFVLFGNDIPPDLAVPYEMDQNEYIAQYEEGSVWPPPERPLLVHVQPLGAPPWFRT